MEELGVPLASVRILELGPGLDFAPQLALAGYGAGVTVADRFLAKWDNAYHNEFYRRFKSRWDGPSTALDAVMAAREYPANVIACIAQPAERLNDIADSSCDVILSNAVLEHVYDLAAVCRMLARITRPGGFSVHQIDFRDHWNFQRPLEFLLYKAGSWQLGINRGRVGRGNRHRLLDHSRYFQDAGFRMMHLDKNMHAEEDYFKHFLPRLRASSSPYRDRAKDDLSVLSAKIILVRAPDAALLARDRDFRVDCPTCPTDTAARR
jgi:SAM-dependent methyltransferase